MFLPRAITRNNKNTSSNQCLSLKHLATLTWVLVIDYAQWAISSILFYDVIQMIRWWFFCEGEDEYLNKKDYFQLFTW